MKDTELYDGKKFSDLLRDIDTIAASKRAEINQITENISKLIENLQDAVMLGPILYQFYQVGIKNDEQLTKLAAVIQRIISASSKSADDPEGLTQEERDKLLKEIELETGKITQEVEQVIKTNVAK